MTRRKSFHPALEALEQRTVPYAVFGTSWANHNISASFLPDGTPSEGYTSNLFATLDQIAPRATWQREFARALQTWANVADLNFRLVSDSGAASGTSGAAQGDSRFGDVRLGAHPTSGSLAYAYFPSSSSTLGGDITLNLGYTYHVGTHIDLYSVLLHEIGHSLGLDHSTSGTVMNPVITGVYSGLSADDVAGIRAIYGARRADSFDVAAANDALSSASALTVGSTGAVTVSADLTSLGDVDFYRLTAPATASGSLSISLDARALSLLAGKVSVFDAAGNLLGTASAPAYGSVATLNLSNVTPGQTLYVVADGATGDAFGMGTYRLQAQFGLSSTPAPTPPSVAPDRFEVNDSLQTATNLGKVNGFSLTGLTLHSIGDVDYFTFLARSTGSFQVSAVVGDSSASVRVSVFDALGNSLASGSGSVTVNFVSGQRYAVKVFSPAGSLSGYDLNVTKLGSGGGRKRGKAVAGDSTYAAGYESLAAYSAMVDWALTGGGKKGR